MLMSSEQNCDYTSDLSLAALFLSGSLVDLIIFRKS